MERVVKEQMANELLFGPMSLAEGCEKINEMIQFLLFVIAITLVVIFWELTKIHTRLKEALRAEKESANKSGESKQTLKEL